MRIDLSKLTSEGLILEWASAQGVQRVVLTGATDLRGTYESRADGYRISNTSAAHVGIEALAVRLSSLEFGLERGGQLDDVVVYLDASAAATQVSVGARGLTASELTLTTESMTISAHIEASAVQLRNQGGEGELSAGRCTLQTVTVRTGDLELESDQVALEELVVRWGASGLQLSVKSAGAGELTLKHALLVGNLADVRIDKLAYTTAGLRTEATRIERAELEYLFPRRRSPAPVAEVVPRPADALSVFDLRQLDGLSGHLHVDVEMDLTVPIIGHRRATHKLRIPIADGAINYRELEDDLASLEDSLLDFSVREGALVLERGLPLITPRGRGKPLLVWRLGPDDLALAQARRVRLAVLPQVQVVSEGGESGAREKPSKLQLRTVSFQNVDAELALSALREAPASALRALAFERLRVTGAVHHEAGPPDPPGKLQAELDALSTTIQDLPLGSARASATVELEGLRNVELAFVDLLPTQLRGLVQRLTLHGLAIG